MIDWDAFWLILAAVSWAVTVVLVTVLVIVTNRQHRADRTATGRTVADEWSRELRGYERERVTRVWPALARHLDDLTRGS